MSSDKASSDNRIHPDDPLIGVSITDGDTSSDISTSKPDNNSLTILGNKLFQTRSHRYHFTSRRPKKLQVVIFMLFAAISGILASVGPQVRLNTIERLINNKKKLSSFVEYTMAPCERKRRCFFKKTVHCHDLTWAFVEQNNIRSIQGEGADFLPLIYPIPAQDYRKGRNGQVLPGRLFTSHRPRYRSIKNKLFGDAELLKGGGLGNELNEKNRAWFTEYLDSLHEDIRPTDIFDFGDDVEVNKGFNPDDIEMHENYIRDYAVPAVTKILPTINQIVQLLEKGHNVLFYCKAGEGRSGFIAALIQTFLRKQDPLGSIRKVNKRYVETPAQKAFIKAMQSAYQLTDRWDLIQMFVDLWSVTWQFSQGTTWAPRTRDIGSSCVEYEKKFGELMNVLADEHEIMNKFQMEKEFNEKTISCIHDLQARAEFDRQLKRGFDELKVGDECLHVTSQGSFRGKVCKGVIEAILIENDEKVIKMMCEGYEYTTNCRNTMPIPRPCLDIKKAFQNEMEKCKKVTKSNAFYAPVRPSDV